MLPGGKYCLERVIGRGGTAFVYLAKDVHLGKQWAVKEVEDHTEMVIREAGLLKDLDHPGLPRVVDLIRDGTKCYLVMDYLQGKSLGQMIRNGYCFSRDEILHIGIELCSIIGYLHTRNPVIIYRDLKPDNVMITKDGQVKLVDFGIARNYFEGCEPEEERYGTKGYAAPEQYRGICDERTDVYGLAAVLAMLVRHSSVKKKEKLRRILRKCMQSDPGKRYQSVFLLQSALEKLCVSKERERQIKTLPALVLVPVLLFCINGIIREAEGQIYIHLAEQVSGYAVTDLTAQHRERVLDICRKAICMFPEREEAYLALLRYETAAGYTAEGISGIEDYQKLYEKETREHFRVAEEIGELYFTGNILDRKFHVNYKKALAAWEKLGDEIPEEIQVQESIAKQLVSSDQETDWSAISEKLMELEVCTQNVEEAERRYELYLAAAGIYLSYERELRGVLESQPLLSGISLLEQAKEQISEMESGSPVRETAVHLRLGDACYLAGMTGVNREESLEKAVWYYGLVNTEELSDSTKRRVLLSMTDALLELEDLQRAGQFLSLAEEIPGIETDLNYTSIRKKYETLYERKGIFE
ncbi:MAG: serine/threonine-protein kinase [Fusicatenibacter sp.]|nr:serine/threonine-protein kinase [Lachnospiraceae bacterium]MDY2938368.1 serine/threonine-protein kinase [Fusicatenibacter sp.]